MSDEANEQPSAIKGALRWAAVLGLAGAVSYAGVRLMDHRRASAAQRVFALDWSRFEGCLLGGATVPDQGLPDALLALAKGTGDEAWPHTCSRPLTRIATAAHALALEGGQEQSLERSATAMESALGEAVFWTRHVQAHRVRSPEWVASFVTLRREVRAWTGRAGVVLPSPEAPRNGRVPRPASEPDDPPPPEPLEGGAEADVVDAIATPTQLSWLFRDRRSRYARCVFPWAEGAQATRIACGAMTLGASGDPRDLGFVASDADPMIVVSQRPPSDLRAVIDGDSFETRLEIAGTSRADRDFVVAAGQVWGVHRARFSLALRRSGGLERPLPRDADTLWTDRAMGHVSGDPTKRAALVWLNVRRGGSGTIRGLDVETMTASSRALRGDWSSYDRSLERCTSGLRTLWLARDGHGGAHVFEWTSAGLAALASIATGVAREHRFFCDATRWALIERGASALRVRSWDGATEQRPLEVPFAGPVDAALAGGSLWVADGGAESGALRVRAFPGTTLLARRTYPVLTAPRGIRIVASGARVLVLARAEQTHAFIARAGASELIAATLAQAP